MPQASAGYVAQVKYMWTTQIDRAIVQANPVSGVSYPILPVTDDVMIQSIEAHVEWAVTQPTPLEVLLTVDGVPCKHVVANPVSNTHYLAGITRDSPALGQPLLVFGSFTYTYAFYPLYMGQSISIDARITWAVTQPTFLVCIVKWSRLLPT